MPLGNGGEEGAFGQVVQEGEKTGKSRKKVLTKGEAGCILTKLSGTVVEPLRTTKKVQKKVLTKPLTSVMIVKLSARAGGEHEIANLKKVEKRA